ncbi:MAG: DUF294 nucleotidyltransferase-like domain-containing protein [Gammaproteobacteria bacterium]|nr:DUF294 nucleotidyltransferase-like domain-containing protein [Gammaproteobacteria bacterium]
MVSEAGDVKSFLAQQHPFNHLTESLLDFVSTNIQVAFSKSGSEIPLSTTDKNEQLAGIIIVRSGSMEIRSHHGELIDRLSSGDYLIPEVLTDGEGHNPQVVVLEDCLYYELSNYAYQSLKSSSQEFSSLSSPEISNESDSAEDNNQGSGQSTYLNQYIKETMSSSVVCAEQSISIRKAAQMMTEFRITSLLIMDSEKLVGIITDRDFRTRVLSKAVADTEEISHVMTPNPMCIDEHSRLHDAQLTMMSAGIHHLPVLRDEKPVGVISLSDVLRANNVEPLSLAKGIKSAASIKELSIAAKGVPGLVIKLIERNDRAVEVGEIITSFADAITRRLLLLAEEKFGPRPCDYAWLAFGSQARQELMLGSDQDNALILPDGIGDKEASYFKEFCEFVNAGLNECGMPYCPGEIMASNEKWRLSLSGWCECFSNWIEEPSPKALMFSSIFFDMRHIAGDSKLTENLQNYVLSRAEKNTIFLALMSGNSLLHSPPLGFFKTFVLENDGDHNHTLDLKIRGTIPIVDIARNYALSASVAEFNTVARLKAIKKLGIMSNEMADSLVDAHDFIAGIRLHAQAEQYRQQIKIDNHLDPVQLSPLVRHQLKAAFHQVREAQAAMKVRFSGGLL